jgi:hypothetical protein
MIDRSIRGSWLFAAPKRLPPVRRIMKRDTQAATEFLKNTFWAVGSSPASLTRTDMEANPKADMTMQSIPFALLLKTRLRPYNTLFEGGASSARSNGAAGAAG